MTVFQDKLISVISFVMFFYTSLFMVAYLLTVEKYANSKEVSDFFPIVINENSNIKVIYWHQYKSDKEKYSSLLFLPSEKLNYQLNEFDSVTIKEKFNGVYKVSYITDDYNFYSKYSVNNGIVVPHSYHLAGAYMVIIAFPVAFFLNAIVNSIRRRYLIKRVKSKSLK